MPGKATEQRWAEARARVNSSVNRLSPRLKRTLTCPICSHRFSLISRRLSQNLDCPSCRAPLRIPTEFFTRTLRLTVAALAFCFYFAYGRLNWLELIVVLTIL